MPRVFNKMTLGLFVALLFTGCVADSTENTTSASENEIDPFNFEPGFQCAIEHSEGREVESFGEYSVRYHRQIKVGVQGTSSLFLSTIETPFNECPYAILVTHPSVGMWPLIIDPTNDQFFQNRELEVVVMSLLERLEEQCELNSRSADCRETAQRKLAQEVAGISHRQFDGSTFRARDILLTQEEILSLGN